MTDMRDDGKNNNKDYTWQTYSKITVEAHQQDL